MAGEHAVVLGASMAGLLAARVLTESFERVTVLERDELTDSPFARRGVPQGRHAHSLLPRGSEILDELFPGFLTELRTAGVPLLSNLREAHFCFRGHQLGDSDHPLSPSGYLASRPFLEHRVRQRVRALPGVEIVAGATANRPSMHGERVTGVWFSHVGEPERDMAAELVVDATGRGGRTGRWLSDLGYPAPAEEQIPVRVKYVSWRLRPSAGALGPIRQVLVGPVPERPTFGALFAQEDNTWTASTGGYAGHHPPTDIAGACEYLRQIVPPEIAAAIHDAELLSEPVSHAFPSNLRRHYQRLTRFPTGLLALGDAQCSFNPIYGQGMTVAALQAMTLRDCLAAGEKDLAQRFFRKSAKPIDVAWRFAAGGDRLMPEVPGQPKQVERLAQAYLNRLLRIGAAGDHDLVLHALGVLGFVKPPYQLFHPKLITRAIFG